MKKIVLTLLAGLMISLAGAQNIFDKLAEEYADKEGFSAVQLTSDMFELYMKKKNIAVEDPVFPVLKDLDNIMVITQTFTADNEGGGDNLKSEIIGHYRDNNYTLFKTEKNPSSDLKIYIEKDKTGVHSLGVVSSNSFSVNLIEMNGVIDLANIASLSKALNIRGLEQLRVFDNNSPTNFDFNYNFNLPDMSNHEMTEERRMEIEERVLQRQKEMEQRHEEMQKRHEEMRERNRELYDKYKRFPIIISGSADEDAEYFVNGEKVELDELKNIDSEKVESIEVLKKDKLGNSAQIKIQMKKEN